MPVITDRITPFSKLRDTLVSLSAHLDSSAADTASDALRILDHLQITDAARFALVTQPTISVDQYAALIGVDRTTASDAARRGEIDTIKVGRRVRVPSAPLRRLLGIDGLSEVE